MAGITRQRLKELVKEVMVEESEYQQFFQKALDKAGKSIPSMSDEEKKAFFDKIDSAWNGKGEKNEALVGGQKELDVDGDGEIEGSDLADLRAGKKANENINEGSKVYFEKKLKDGTSFQVIDRDTTGMRGSQDAFLMQIVDKNGKVVKHIGSHVSVDGAKKYSNKFESVKVNEISSIDGLNDILKGQTSQIEGTKLSKGMAEHIINWMNTSPYGKKYNPWVKKNSIAKILPIAFNWGLERGLPANLKNEFVALKAKYATKSESVKKK